MFCFALSVTTGLLKMIHIFNTVYMINSYIKTDSIIENYHLCSEVVL